MIEISADFLSKFIGKYSLGKDEGNNSSHFLRIKIPGGRINSEDLNRIADLSDEFGKGYLEVTDRQDFQLHWIDPDQAMDIFEKLYDMGYTTDLCGQAFRETCHGDVRNVVACPLMGRYGEDFFDLVRKINDFFSGNPDYIVLPHKFKIAITSCGGDCVKFHANDLSLYWNGSAFIPFVGGGMGASFPGVRYSESLRLVVYREEAFDFVRAMVEIHRDCSNTDSKAKARFKYLYHRIGRDGVVKELRERGIDIREFHSSVDLRLELIEHERGVQRDGKGYYTLPLLGGRLSSEKLRVIARLCSDYGSGEVVLTTWQNILFPDVENISSLKLELSKYFDVEVPYKVVACASDFCGRTVFHAKDLLEKIVREVGVDDLAISGCINGCACHPIAEYGFVGKIRKGEQLYDMYRRGSLIEKDLKPEKILTTLQEGLYEIKA
jgi:sulfite reductase beta subunit-like hemoprotein